MSHLLVKVGKSAGEQFGNHIAGCIAQVSTTRGKKGLSCIWLYTIRFIFSFLGFQVKGGTPPLLDGQVGTLPCLNNRPFCQTCTLSNGTAREFSSCAKMSQCFVDQKHIEKSRTRMPAPLTTDICGHETFTLT